MYLASASAACCESFKNRREIGELHYLVALVVVAENHRVFAERGLAAAIRSSRCYPAPANSCRNRSPPPFNFGRSQSFGLFNSINCVEFRMEVSLLML